MKILSHNFDNHAPRSVCPQCGGSGTYCGLFHNSPCAHCHGSGYAAEDGEALPLIDLIVMLSQQRDYWRHKYTLVIQVPGVQDAMANHATAQEEQALGYSSGRYQGD